MIVRELVAVLGLEMDDQAFNKAEKKFDTLTRAASALGAVLVSGAVALGIRRFVGMASDVEETQNVMRETFEGSSGAVEAWAAKTGAAVNRSRFSLQKYAADVGAIVKPMLGSSEAAAEMSMTLSKLAVDTASFFNNNDQEAMTRLISGLMGQTESIVRLGVDLTEESMKKLAAGQGKVYQQMTQGEKVQLRYQKIMIDTADAQGDAVRTADGYANATRGLAEMVKDLEIAIGKRLLPAARAMVVWSRNAVSGFLRLVEGTRFLETALVVLGGIATIVGIKMLLPFLPAILAAAALTAAVGAVILALEDLYVFIIGGDSLIGGWLAKIGVDVDKLRGFFQKLGELAEQVWDRIKAKVIEVAGRLDINLGGALDKVGEKLNGFLDWAAPRLDKLLAMDWDAKIQAVKQFFDDMKTKATEFLNSPAGKAIATLLGGVIGAKIGGLKGAALGAIAGNMLGGDTLGGEIVGGQAGMVGGALAGGKLGLKGGLMTGLLGVLLGGGLGGYFGSKLAGASTPSIPGPGVAMGNRMLKQELTVTVNGNAGTQQIEEARKVFREEMERQNRTFYHAMLPSFSGGKL